MRHQLGIFVALLLCSSAAHAQLDKGHQILLDRGIQIQAQAFYMPEDTGGNPFIPQTYFDANFTSINWHYHPANPQFTSAYPNYPWSRWINTSGTYDVTAAEQPYKNQLVAVQYKDENSLNNPDVRADFKNWFDNARPNFPNTILYTNQLAFDATGANLATYMSESKPDMMFMDSYRWKVGNTEGTWHLLSDMQRYRKAALRGHDQTGARPIPYGLLTQTFHGENLWRDPSESELRANHFMAWALGYTYTSAFTYNYGTSSLFSPGYDTTRPTPTYHQLKEVNKEGSHLSPALVRLISKDVLFVPGQHKDGSGATVNNPTPIDMLAYPGGFNAAVKDPYIRGVQSIANLGTTNDGLKGDFLLTWFQVLDESLDGPDFSGEWYFMITNGLTDPGGSAQDTRQTIQINFAANVPQYVQRLNRDTGLVDDIFLPLIPASTRRRLVLELEGGTGDLFKFKTGAPFVGVPIPEPAGAVMIAFAMASSCARRRRA